MKKNYLLILCWNILGVALLVSQYYTYRDGFWFNIDSAVFHYFNQFLDDSHQVFLYTIAITNYRAFDIVSFLVMALLYFYYFRQQSNCNKRKMIVIGCMMLLMAIIIKQLGRYIPISHESASLFFEQFEHVNRVSKLTHFCTKDASSSSFPSDHGMMLMIFAGFMWRYFGLRAFIQSAIIVIILSAPRIIAGAHCFTDVYVGSLAICSIVLSWFLLTPASDDVANFLLRFMPKRVFNIP